MRTFLSIGVALALSGASTAGHPQDTRGDRPFLSVGTDLVRLTVTVIDRRGHLVSGLTQADFTVFDNGERQPIQFFTSEDIPATVGLVIDASSSMRGQRDIVTAAAD